jgi:ADP-ribose pyrophosphatase YjhB (NUDIX family)
MPHLHYQYDFVVSVFIVHEQSVLLVRHPRYAKWLPIGGHIELNEDPEQTLYREIQEECNLEVEVLSDKPSFLASDARSILPPRYIEVHEANLPHQHIALIYFARSKTDTSRISDEHTAMCWLQQRDLIKPEYDLSESVQFYCREALNVASK